MKRSLLLALALVGALWACGGSSPGSAGSCMGGKETNCTTTLCCQDYRGNFTSATAQSSCSAISGTYSSTACPSANRVGSCALYEGTAAEQIVRYYAGYTVPDHQPGTDSASANCDALHIGNFTAN
ncbi:MAG: hypothetical protein U1E65_16700 [Myxococcota bacterium]